MKQVQIWISEDANKLLIKSKKKDSRPKWMIASDSIVAGLPKLAEAEKVKKAIIGGR